MAFFLIALHPRINQDDFLLFFDVVEGDGGVGPDPFDEERRHGFIVADRLRHGF